MTNQLKNTLENQVLALNNFFNSGKVNDLISQLTTQQTVANKTKLGITIGEIQGGFLNLTETVDDIVPGLTTSIPTQTIASDNVIIARLTESVPGVESQLKQTVTSSADLQLITGSATSVASDLLDVVISSGTPEAIAAAVKQTVPTVKTNDLNTIVEGVVDVTEPLEVNFSTIDDLYISDPSAVRSALHSAIAGVTNTRGGSSSVQSNIISTINRDISNLTANINSGFGSLIENVVENTLSPARNTIAKITIKNGIQQQIKEADLRAVISFVAIDDYNNALKIVRKYSDKSDIEIIDALKQIDNRLATATARPTTGVNIKAKDISGYENQWDGPNTPFAVFNKVNFKEELLADLLSTKRDITEVVVHHTFTGFNQNLSAGDLQLIYSTTYGIGIPYHYIITREGNIERGRPINIKTEPFINNHHLNSIHVAFVGGLNIPTRSYGQVNTEQNTSSKSFTIQQWAAFNIFLETGFKAYPGLQILGHNSIDRQAADPNFDPSEYVEALYNKKLLFTDPYIQQPFTRQQLIERNIQQ